jgi:methyl-accepting chemotaxis protein
MRGGLLSKMVISTGALVSALLVVNTWLTVRTTRQVLLESFVARAEAQAARLIGPLQQGYIEAGLGLEMLGSFWADARDMVASSHGLIRSVAFVDRGGVVRIHNDRTRIGTREPDRAVLDTLPRLGPHPVLLETAAGPDLIVLVPVRDLVGQAVGAIRLGLSRTTLVEAWRRALVQQGILLALSLLVTFAISALLVTRAVVGPLSAIGDAAGAIASGRLAERVPVTSDDKIATLGRQFNQMAGQLESLLRQVRDTSSSVAAASTEVVRSQARVREGAAAQQASLDHTAGVVTALSQATASSADRAEALSSSAQSVLATSLELSASAEELTQHVDDLVRSVESTSAATTQIAASLRQVAGTVDQLAQSTDVAASTIAQMDASMAEIERVAEETAQVSTQVAQDADGGRQAVEAAAQGMEEIRTSGAAASEVLRGFERTAAEIGQILGIIDEVADQTNLLALNAAIIAAQAGEHGRGFSVVAEEIKALAERTGASTREIAALIDRVQTGSRAAMQAMTRGELAIAQGMERSRRVSDALAQILAGAQRTQEMVARIARATQDHATGSRQVTASVHQISDMTRQLRVAAEEQSRSGGDVARAATAMAEASRLVYRSAHDQQDASKAIGRTMVEIAESVRLMAEASQQQKRETEAILTAMATIRGIAETTTSTATNMGGVVEALTRAAAVLQTSLARFHLSA